MDRHGADSHTETGGFIAGNSRPAYSLAIPGSAPIPILIAVPHAGRDYPLQVLSRMRDPEMTSLRLEDRHVDLLAREVARQTGAPLILAHAPRAMLDLNRARDDVDWAMIEGGQADAPRHSQANRRARSGLGLVPRRLPGFGEIWKGRLTREELEARIEGIHRPYHAAVARALERIRDDWGVALLLDFHSMPPLKRWSGEGRTPHFVLGDRFGASCDGTLVFRGLRYFERQGEVAAHNRPYSGGFVLDHHAAPGRGLHALQLEVCRSRYLDRRLAEPGEGLGDLARLVAGMVRELGAATARLAQGGPFAQAAE